MPTFASTQFDLSDAFYQFKMPEPLRPSFCLPPVTCQEVGVFKIGGRSLPAVANIYPQCRAMAMGWTHALAWCQSIFSRVARKAAPLWPLPSDYAPTPHLSEPPVLPVYVDNLAVIGTDETAVREAGTAILAVTAVGLKTHEWKEESGSFFLLGLHFEDNVLSPKVPRLWKVWQSIRYVLKSGALTSRQLSVLVWHFTSLAMVRRELLSVLRSVYAFNARRFSKPT